MQDKWKARQSWKSGRASVCEDGKIISPWTPRAQAALVADFALFGAAACALMLAGAA